MNLLTFLTCLATINASYAPLRSFGRILRTSELCEILSSYTSEGNAAHYKVLPFKYWTELNLGCTQRHFTFGDATYVGADDLRKVILPFEPPIFGLPRVSYNTFLRLPQQNYFGTVRLLDPPALKNNLSDASFPSTSAAGNSDAYELSSDEKENLGDTRNVSCQEIDVLPEAEDLEQTRQVVRQKNYVPQFVPETKPKVQESLSKTENLEETRKVNRQGILSLQTDNDLEETRKVNRQGILSVQTEENLEHTREVDRVPQFVLQKRKAILQELLVSNPVERSVSDRMAPSPRYLKAPWETVAPIPTEAEPAKPPVFRPRMGMTNRVCAGCIIC